ncbi:MAG: hypothetical protein QOJ40_629 [Verrucomicrobiota bacterium]
MSNTTSKLKDRLELKEKSWYDLSDWSGTLDSARKLGPNASDWERAWSKLRVANRNCQIALVAYFAEQPEVARQHGKQCLDETMEFLFGNWRETYITDEGHPDPKWWKTRFDWMEVFEGALLWGSVLGEWAVLQKAGAFPEPDSCTSDGYRPQERDLYVALGGFLHGAPRDELDALLQRASSGPSKSYKLIVESLRACVARDEPALQKSLNEFLKHYKKTDFPKNDFTQKVSFKGTFFFHRAQKEGLAITIRPEYSDHIVPASLIQPSAPSELTTR